MSVLDIISELRKYQVVPKLDGEHLKLVGETKNLPDAFLTHVRTAKDQLIAFLKEASGQSGYSPILPVAPQPDYAATNAQRRIWLLSQFKGGTAAYNIIRCLYLKGTVDAENLNRAFQASVNRHESLRTVFTEFDGQPRQVIREQMPFNMRFEDISAVADIKERLKDEIAEASASPYDLESGPLLRVYLYRLSSSEYAMIFSMHHIISDGWSIAVLVREVMQRYEALCKNQPDATSPLTIHYKDYAGWLHERLESPKGKQAAVFWNQEFAAPAAPLILPADFPRPEMRSFDGAIAKFYFSDELYKRITGFCRLKQLTLFNFYRSVITLLLYKFSGQRELVIGTPVSGRNHYDLENQAGLYVNTLPLKAVVNPDEAYIEFARKISDHSFRAFEYQDYPLDKMIEDLDLKRDNSRNPLFDVMLVLQNTAIGDGTINMNRHHGFDMSLLDDYLYPGGRAGDQSFAVKFDLNFNFDSEPGNKYYLEIEYSTRLFRAERIRQYHEAFLYIISQVTSRPDASVASVEVISEKDRHKVLHEFNRPISRIDVQSIQQLLTNSFLKHADDTAIVCAGRKVSYGELDRLSYKVADYIIQSGLIAAVPFVGVYMDRSEWVIVTILGILKSGAAYVPVDPVYPASRISYLLSDARPAMLITDERNTASVPENYTGMVVSIHDIINSGNAGNSVQARDLREAPAYLIYTSGSTGAPKGVEICHRNTIAFLKWAADEFATTPFETLYATTSFCFDLSVFEFFFPLMMGRTVRMLPSAIDIPEYAAGDRQILLNTVPSVVRHLLDTGMNWENVTALNMAGEPVPGRLKDELDYRRMEVRNLYGPSEDTTYSTIYRFRDDGYTAIPIGVPVGYTQLYIINADGNLLPPGVEGEIYLTGQSVANGYLNQPDLTARVFISNPFIPGTVMYKTGDVGKWLPDGMVAFSGRIDDQVKVRGFRIEPGEIQYLLEQHSGVQQAVVLVREIGGDNQLIAYWVSHTDTPAAVLKSYLSEKLPAYMVPDYWVPLQEVPLNSNGKIDKKRLPHPATGVPAPGALMAPKNELEAALLNIWKAVLLNENIGVNTNFFDAGGHSLRAAKLRSLVSSGLQRQLSLDDIFSAATIEKQAILLERAGRNMETVIPQAAHQAVYPISVAQERLWVLTKFQEASVAYNMPAAFRITGHVNISLLEASLNSVIKRHEILRTVFKVVDNTPVQVILQPGERHISIGQIHLSGEPDDAEVMQLLREKWKKAFDLENGPLLECFIIHSTAGSVLSFNMHHIISDGWSVTVLFKEITRNYQRLISGKPLLSDVPEIQYKDFAVWQRQALTGNRLQEYMDFWKGQFTDELPVLELPYDAPRPEVKTYDGTVAGFALTPALTRQLEQLNSRLGVSLFMTLLSGVAVLLKKYSGQNELVMGTPVAGRDHVQLEDQIGFYVNTMAIRCSVAGNESFEALLMRQKSALLAAFSYQDFPFELLVEALQPARNLSRSPLFDVMVVLQNIDGLHAGDMSFTGDGLKLDRLDVPATTAKYDLTFTFAQTDGQLRLELEYNTHLFRPETVQRMGAHLVKIFEQVSVSPQIAVRDINLLSADESRLLLSKADQTAASYDTSATIVSLFEKAAATFPGNIALSCNNEQITYRQLDLLSGQLAARLMGEFGVTSEDLIMLHCNRTQWMLIAILGVLKAGAAYIPADPGYPAGRISYMLRDSNCSIILFDTAPDADLIEKHPGVRALQLDTLELTGQPVTATVLPHNLAYIIYTSGTTGNPKGVLIEHRNVTRLLCNENNHFDFSENDRWSLFHSYAFDFSVWEMYGALLYGGTLVMVPRETAQDAITFYDFLLNSRVTVLNQTPTAFRSLTLNNRNRLAKAPLAVKWLIFGGEALMPEVLRDWHAAMPNCKLINMYGITETTVHVTYKEITAAEINENRSNIGVPIPTLSCYVLDSDLQQVPVGVPGELCVGGAGVARGYLNKPELTAQKFVDNPFRPGEKIYRSGDFARILPNGDLEYIGRRDDQVKIRGHRIELAEVESTFRQLEGITDVVVLPVKAAGGEYDLAAYFIAANEVSSNTLRTRLAGLLPGYMVPSIIIALDAFPLNANGKLDKKALPQAGTGAESRIHVGPRNEIDRQIIEIWEQVLERSGIGLQDNFFDLGGHSLKATRVISKIHEVYGVRIDLKNLFIAPTVEHLSNYVETLRWMEDRDEVLADDGNEIIF